MTGRIEGFLSWLKHLGSEPNVIQKYLSLLRKKKLDIHHARENDKKSMSVSVATRKGICLATLISLQSPDQVSEHRLMLSQKKLYFNRFRSKQRLWKYKNMSDLQREASDLNMSKRFKYMLLATNSSLVKYPVLVGKVGGMKCRDQ